MKLLERLPESVTRSKAPAEGHDSATLGMRHSTINISTEHLQHYAYTKWSNCSSSQVLIVNHHTDQVAVDCGTVSIDILLASMNRVDPGSIFNHHGYYFVFPLLRTANGCERNKPETHGIALEMQKFIQKPSRSPDWHRTKSAEVSIEPSQHLPSTARSPAANAQYIVIASPEPGMSPALLVRAPQKSRPGRRA